MALKPITRKEQIVAGKDLEPITRMERFLKDYGVSNYFGETTVNGDTLTWDGNTEGLISINDPESGQPYLYKISGATITPDDYENGVSLFAKDIMDESVTFSAEYITEKIAEESVVPFTDWVYYAAKDNAAVFGAVFPEAGWYHVAPAVGGGVLCTVTIPGYTGFETTAIKPIDEKYLPPLVSPSGKKFKLSVDDSGVLSATEV